MHIIFIIIVQVPCTNVVMLYTILSLCWLGCHLFLEGDLPNCVPLVETPKQTYICGLIFLKPMPSTQ
jgi:hypothetical protein